jgi:hypothetical protein
MPAANCVPRSDVTIEHDVGSGSDTRNSRPPSMDLHANSGRRGVWEIEAKFIAGLSPVALRGRCVGIASGIPDTNRCRPVLSEIRLQHEAAQGSTARNSRGPRDPDHCAQGVTSQEIAGPGRSTGTFGARDPQAQCRGERNGANPHIRRVAPRVHSHVPLEPSLIVAAMTVRSPAPRSQAITGHHVASRRSARRRCAWTSTGLHSDVA